jgi:hypothetical protein
MSELEWKIAYPLEDYSAIKKIEKILNKELLMIYHVLPKDEENPIRAFHEALMS